MAAFTNRGSIHQPWQHLPTVAAFVEGALGGLLGLSPRSPYYVFDSLQGTVNPKKQTPPFNPNKNQRSGTPRAVEFPEEWNSQGSSGAPRGVELPGGWNSQGWNSQGACFVFAFHFNTDGRGRGNLIPCLSKIIIVKVEYSSRKRSGLGATMVHQLKVERSKPCGQFFLPPGGF